MAQETLYVEGCFYRKDTFASLPIENGVFLTSKVEDSKEDVDEGMNHTSLLTSQGYLEDLQPLARMNKPEVNHFYKCSYPRARSSSQVFMGVKPRSRVGYEHVAINLTRLGLAAATIRNSCRFRISQVTYRRACLMLALEGFPSSLLTLKYHSDVLARSQG
ncbi:hypothetical protein Tco_0858723 [Tanacetum coccineum]|uniref:Uncharacterized protein n=1 Tax=Tanacetum coccineum TaxID=301880 RepID=A0ABQ5BAN6_9ASTR